MLRLVLLLLSAPALAVTELGTRFSGFGSVLDQFSASVAGTVPANTELLVCGIAFEGGATSLTGANWNTSETMTVIASHVPTAGGEIGLYAVALLAPTAATDDVTFNFTGGGGIDWFTGGCVSYDVVDDASLDAATDVDTVVVTQIGDGVTVVLPNFGAAGNALLIFASKIGADSDPASIDDGSYTELWDFDSGGGVNNSDDGGFAVYQQLSAAGADGGTVTFSGGNDPRVGVQIEINTEATSAAKTRRRHKNASF